MPRYKLTIEYDGTAYSGWQRQDDAPSVQQAIETAIFKFSSEKCTITTAGRTDAGVHATAQVAHVDLQKDWPCDTVCNALNAHLSMAKETVSILSASIVPETFDARFSAIKRYYLYRILNRRSQPALEINRAWWVPRCLDEKAMDEAAKRFLGKHDFTTFRAAQCQARSPIRTVDQCDVMRHGEIIEIRVSARSFLHHQVRSFAGSLMEVGVGRWTADDLEEALKACDRARCGVVAPSCGLYLISVDYPEA